MEIKDVRFIKSAQDLSGYPEYVYPEAAFFGRSNCGKSSLINMIVNRKQLVKTGSKPGMTQLINFFLANESLSLVDLPGYGYAEAPASVREKFHNMTWEYLENRTNLKMLFLLQDSRRSPGNEEVELAERLIKLGLPYAVVATKTDKLSKGDIKKSVEHMAGILGKQPRDVFVTSSVSRAGRRELLAALEKL